MAATSPCLLSKFIPRPDRSTRENGFLEGDGTVIVARWGYSVERISEPTLPKPVFKAISAPSQEQQVLAVIDQVLLVCGLGGQWWQVRFLRALVVDQALRL